MASKNKKTTPAIDVPGIAAACDALSCDVRAAVVAHLSRTGTATVGELRQSANTSISGTSQHLAKLKAAGTVTVRRDAQRMIYSLTPGWVEKLIGKLREMVGGGEDVAARLDGEISGSRSVPDVKKNAEATEKPKKKRNPTLLGAAEVTPIVKKKAAGSWIADAVPFDGSESVVSPVDDDPAAVKPKSRKKSAKKVAPARPDASNSHEIIAADAEPAKTVETRPDAQDEGVVIERNELYSGGPVAPEDEIQSYPDELPDTGSGDAMMRGTTYSPERGW